MSGRPSDIAWEEVDEVPPPRKPGGTTFGPQPEQRLILKPGQILRRPISASGMAGGWRFAFRNTGRTDHHVAERLIDGQLYAYIWRDSEAAS